MTEFLTEYFDITKVLDGTLFAMGMAALWVGGVFTMSIARSLGVAGGAGIMWFGKFVHGRHRYTRGNSNDLVNVTLNTSRGGRLTIDTVVADVPLTDAWPNMYHVMRLKAAAKCCTIGDPLIRFEQTKKNGHWRVNEYHATYDPLISMIAERCTNEHSIDLSLGVPMEEYRFVIALTFEKLNDVRSQHFRVMMVLEEELLNWPESVASFDRDGHRTRFETLKAIAKEYREHPEYFGVVKAWRPKGYVAADINSIIQRLPKADQDMVADRAKALIGEVRRNARPAGYGRLGGGGTVI